jgi:threonine dehydratase
MGLTEKEQKILDSIVVRSEDNPHKPEFPSDSPKFPATPAFKIDVEGFSDVWVKDESKNPTGTHKDRLAWEIIVTYRDFLLAKQSGQVDLPLPHMSIISSGSAAVTIQSQLKKFGLPGLKVLVDTNISKNAMNSMRSAGCEIYETDLSRQAFGWREILQLTDNENGIDITKTDPLDPRRFYDWLSYEIINISPDYCFVPFGTGNLYENILQITRKEVSTKKHDPRFKGDPLKLRNCSFLGATTNNPKTFADKLYSPHLPFVHFDEQWIRLYKQAGYCGQNSNVHILKENFLEQAMGLAKEQSIQCEYSGIAGLALMLQMKDRLPKDKKMLIVNTGKTISQE